MRLGVERREGGSGQRTLVVPLLFLAPDRATRRFEAAALHLLNNIALALDCNALVLEQRIKEDDLAMQRRWREAYGATLSPGGKRPADGVAVCLEHAALVDLHKRYSEAEMRRWAAMHGAGGGDGGDGDECNLL